MSDELPDIRLADSVTHLLLALFFILQVDTGQNDLLMDITFVLCVFLAPLSAVLILANSLHIISKIRK